MKMDAETFSGLCKVRSMMEQREWVCARNIFDDTMNAYLEKNGKPNGLTCKCENKKKGVNANENKTLRGV